MITVQFDDSRAMARFTAMPEKLRRGMLKTVNKLAIQLADRVRRKLSGEVLNVVSGALRASIFEEVEETPSSIVGTVGSSGDVKYAGIHEFGGIIPAHEILPVKAKALAFEGSRPSSSFVGPGNIVFAKRVQLPDVRMPERSYLRSSLAEMREQITEELRRAAVEAMQ